MANPGMRHFDKSAKSDPVDTTLIGATKWNKRHYFLEDDGTTVAGTLGDLPYNGTGGLVTLLTGAAGVLTSAGSGNVPAWTMSPSITSLTLASAGVLAWSTDVNIVRDAADTPALRRTTTAQALRVYRTFTDASNYERMEIGADISGIGANTFSIVARAAGTGTQRGLYLATIGAGLVGFVTNGTTRWTIDGSSGHLLAQGAYSIGDGAGSSPVNIFYEGYGEWDVIATPSAPGASKVRLYADTSGGKVRLRALFPSGASQAVATEP